MKSDPKKNTKTSTPRLTLLTRILVSAGALLLGATASAQITFYEDNDFRGRSFSTGSEVGDFRGSGFNDRASSVYVERSRWEVCENAFYGGQCRVLRPGRYPALSNMGLNDRISSVRQVGNDERYDDDRYAPLPQHPYASAYDGRRRDNERLFDARVLSVRAVVGEQSEQRCWIERGQTSTQRGDPNVTGGVVGAVLGGILGHQFGRGTGRDVATAAGAIGGAVVGSNVDREREVVGPDVRRCTDGDSRDHGRTQYWDVTYIFRGQEHRMQTRSPPGATVRVNGRGEPRG